MTSKSEALVEIHKLMSTHNIAIHDIEPITHPQKSVVLNKAMAYLGGALIVMGLVTYLGMEWRYLGSLERVVLTFGPGFITFIAGITALHQNKESGTSIATPLFFLAALFQSGGLFTFLAEYARGDDPVLGSLLVSGVMTLQFLGAFIAYRTPALALFTLIFAHFACASTFDLMGVEPRYYTATLGLSGLMIGSALAKTKYESITGLGFIFSGFSLTSACFVIFNNTPFDVLMILIAGFMIYASVLLQRRSLLSVGIISLFGYLGYFTNEYFKDIVGWPIALMVIGIILIVGSNYAIQLGRRFSKST